MKWEYKLSLISLNEGSVTLAQAGAEGWEAVGMLQANGLGWATYVLFKRPKPDVQQPDLRHD